VAFAELTEGWTWSSAWFILARLRWRDVGGQRQTVVQEQPEVALGEFESACPLWHNGGLCLQGQFLHLRVESAPRDPAGPVDSAGPVNSAGPVTRAGPRLHLVDGALPILPSARALDRSKVAPQALGLEAVAALHWHIHM